MNYPNVISLKYLNLSEQTVYRFVLLFVTGYGFAGE